MTEKEKTAPVVSVGADTEQSILKQTNNSITEQKMNNIRNRATEIVNAELIYTV